MDINERIFKLLKLNGLKNKELSEGTGIASSTISEWKKGVALKPDMIIRVSEFLKVSTDYLLLGKESNLTYLSNSTEMALKETDHDYNYSDFKLSEIEKEMNENFIDIGSRLANRMSELNLKQIDVCKMTGISKNAISNYINNIRIPDTTSVYKLSKALDVSIEWILMGEEYPIRNISTDYTNSTTDPLIREDIPKYDIGNFTFSQDEIRMILRHREGQLIIVDKIHGKIHGEIGKLDERETDLILKFREIEEQEKEDVYDNLCWRYERMIQKKISSGSKIG